MKRQVAAALCMAVLGALTVASSLAIARQNTVKACREEWRANKASRPTGGTAEQTFVAQCRAGTAATPSATAPGAPGDPTPGSRPDAGNGRVYTSVKEIMESIVDPSADTVWGASGTVVDKEGIHDAAPKTPEEWLDVRRAAVRIIEAGNLLTMRGRQAAPPGTKSEAPGVELEPPQITAMIAKNRKSFDAFARMLQGVGVESLRASDARNIDLLLEIGARMENVCESCHQVFWYPQDRQATP